MPLHLPSLSLLTVALLLSPLQLAGVRQSSNSVQQTQPTPDNPKKAEADRLYQQGRQQYRTSQFQEALQSYQQALEIYREIGDRTAEGIILSNIGAVYRSLGQYPQALEQLQQALVVAREVGDRTGEGTILNNIGWVYDSLGQYPQALEQYQQALVIRRELGDRAGEGTTLSNIGLVYRSLGQYPQALEQYQQALVIIREVGNRAGEGTILNNMGAVFLETGQLAAATKILFSAIEVQDSLRAPELSDADKVSLFDTQTDPYNLLQQALIAQNQPETALEVSERGRARAFVDLLSRRVSLEAMGRSNAASAPTIEQIKQTAHEQNATLVQYSIAYTPFQIDGKQKLQRVCQIFCVRGKSLSVIYPQTR